jgi:hypothetical protein
MHSTPELRIPADHHAHTAPNVTHESASSLQERGVRFE